MTELEKRLMSSLEELNLKYIDLQNSKERRTGKNLLSILRDLKRGKLSGISLMMKKRRGQRKIDRLYPPKKAEENFPDEIRLKNIDHIVSKARVAVYTCVVGSYDQVADPIFANEGFDFFIFSDKPVQSELWKNREIPEKVKALQDNTLINRYLKMHPFEVFPEYDYAIYIDGNVCVASDVSPLLSCADGKTGFAMHRHVLRNSIYEEAEVCILYGKGNAQKLREQISEYKNKQFPSEYGMLEATVIVFNLKNKECAAIMNDWWNEFVRSESKRDQIALPYVLWKRKIKIDEVGYLGNNVYRNPKFHIESH